MTNKKKMSNSETGGTRCVYVLSDIDGFKYRLVMEGDVRLLTTSKLKRYLQNATGLSAQQQELSFRGRVMQDGECGGDVGLVDGAVLQLRHVKGMRRTNSGDGRRVKRLPSSSMSMGGVAHRGRSSVVDAASCASPTAGLLTPLQGSHPRDGQNGGEAFTSPPPREMSYRSKRMGREAHALEIENARLEERLLEMERRLANASSDWRLQEEIEQLKGIIAQLLREKEAAGRSAEEKWRAKEEELVKELDLMREERRRLHREQTLFEEEQRALVRSLEEQVRSQQQRLLEQGTTITQQTRQRQPAMNVAEKVEKSLKQLSLELNIPQLHLDDNDTCVLPLGDGTNILVTLDTITERLFMYAVIANSLPSNAGERLELFEMLLEGALLGRDMATGGVGVCLRNDLIIMNVCVDIVHADEYALASIARPFMESVQHWSEAVKKMMPEKKN
ncbi:hypothetical protein ECC02_002547 [Trypanosoma cruzi]|uniref:Ubiquitin-like domain-containing protein n=1 Tax=Trypanosoma cruzi TaxID=5693 RepID=A0A7J6YC31_TRYCR|nr:hypothetical protein ECC02_002547 [Trypanosoma cruzi]